MKLDIGCRIADGFDRLSYLLGCGVELVRPRGERLFVIEWL